MKVLGRSSLSSKIKFLLDAMWFVGCAGVGIWIVVGFFLLSGNSCSKNEKCSSRVTIDRIGFKMDSTSNQLRSLDGGVAYFSEGSGKFTIINGQVSKTTAVAIVFEGALLGFLFLFAIWQLWKLFKTFIQETPFTETNIGTLKLIAVSIFGIGIFSCLSSLINALLLNQQFSGEGIQLVSNGDLNMSSIFSAIVIFILAEIFRLGSQLEDEKAHTV